MKSKFLSVLAASLVVLASPAISAKTTGEFVDDTTVTAEVKAGLAQAKGVPSMDVNVDTYKGVVLLSGFVTDQAAKTSAGNVAKGVKGVSSVQNSITVAPETSVGEKIDDTALVGKVKAALIDEKGVASSQINVEARNGVVQLGGFVDNASIKSKAIAVAKGVKGTKRVDDAMRIKQ